MKFSRHNRTLCIIIIAALLLPFLLMGCQVTSSPEENVPVYLLSKWEKTTTGAEPKTVTFTYDENGTLRKQEDKNGYQIWDAKGNLLSDLGINDHKQYTYDKAGNCLSMKFFSDSGELLQEDYYTYDTRGNPLSYTQLTCNGTYEYNKKYTYDRRGNMLTCSEYFNKNPIPVAQTEKTYDAAGNLIKSQIVQAGVPTVREEYTYNAQGQILTHHYYSDDRLTQEWRYTYDGQSRKIKTVGKSYRDGNTTESISAWDYDSAGNLLKYTQTDELGTSETVYTYDSKGNRLSKTYLHEKTPSETLWTYDEKGNQLSETRIDQYGTSRIDCTYNSAGKILTKQYDNDPQRLWHWTYDENGNVATYACASFTVRYSYICVQVPQSLAQTLIAQQETLRNTLDNPSVADTSSTTP